MKNLILFICFIFLNSCKSQLKINTIYDQNLVENITKQFSKEINIDPNKSIFAIYFQEKPLVTEVKNNTPNNKYKGFIVTIYKFHNEYQINEFVTKLNVYKVRDNIFCIFDKDSRSTFLKHLKINNISKSYPYSNNSTYYDPKTWILNFDSDGKLEKCYPYECNIP